MPRPSQLTLAKDDILSLFSEATQKIYSQVQLADVLRQHRRSWRLAKHTTPTDFISFLLKQGDLRTHKFHSEIYQQEITRYSWGKASPLEVVMSIKSRAYFSHATAVTLHGLAKLGQKKIYLNFEQSPKPPSYGSLTQEGINRAFSRKQRQSNLVYKYNGVAVVMISGKNTNRLGVKEFAGPASEAIRVTNLERTLIDIIVRPAYAGDISQVLRAYRAAKNRLSAEQLLAILKKLDYAYPYHQSIGFMMQKAGYPEKAFAPLRALGLDYDFYLAHGVQQLEYSQEWRLFYPKSLKT